MAAYAASVTSLMRSSADVDASGPVRVFAGKVNITNYNGTTPVEITDITGKFKNIVSVIAGSSDEGYVFRWDSTERAFRAYEVDNADASAQATLQEVADDTDVGEADFIAIGVS